LITERIRGSASIGNFMRVSITLKRGGRRNQGRSRVSRTPASTCSCERFPTSMTLFLFRSNVREIYPARSVTARHAVGQSAAGSNGNGRTRRHVPPRWSRSLRGRWRWINSGYQPPGHGQFSVERASEREARAEPSSGIDSRCIIDYRERSSGRTKDGHISGVSHSL